MGGNQGQPGRTETQAFMPSFSCMRCVQQQTQAPAWCSTGRAQNTKSNELCFTADMQYQPLGRVTRESTKYLSTSEQNFFNACRSLNVSALRYFLRQQGININILDEERTSPLHVAARFANRPVVEELLNFGAHIDITDCAGWTPLHIASQFQRTEIVLLLRHFGANEYIKNKDNRCALELAKDIATVNAFKIPVEVVRQPQFIDERLREEILNASENSASKPLSSALFTSNQGSTHVNNIDANQYLTLTNNIQPESQPQVPMLLSPRRHEHYLYFHSLKKNKLQDNHHSTKEKTLNNSDISSEQHSSSQDGARKLNKAVDLYQSSSEAQDYAKAAPIFNEGSSDTQNLQKSYSIQFQSRKIISLETIVVCTSLDGSSSQQAERTAPFIQYQAQDQKLENLLLALFAIDPLLSIALMVALKVLPSLTGQALGEYIASHREQLSQQALGQLLTQSGLQERYAIAHALMQTLEPFHNRRLLGEQLNLVQTLRNYFRLFQLQVDSLMVLDDLLVPFSELFFRRSPQNFASAEAVHLLSFAALLTEYELHRSANNSGVSYTRSAGTANLARLRQDFYMNVLGINNGKSFSATFINSIFDQLVAVPVVRMQNVNSCDLLAQFLQQAPNFAQFIVDGVTVSIVGDANDLLAPTDLDATEKRCHLLLVNSLTVLLSKDFLEDRKLILFSVFQLRIKEEQTVLRLRPDRSAYMTVVVSKNDSTLAIIHRSEVALRFDSVDSCLQFNKTLRENYGKRESQNNRTNV